MPLKAGNRPIEKNGYCEGVITSVIENTGFDQRLGLEYERLEFELEIPGTTRLIKTKLYTGVKIDIADRRKGKARKISYNRLTALLRSLEIIENDDQLLNINDEFLTKCQLALDALPGRKVRFRLIETPGTLLKQPDMTSFKFID